MSQMRLEDSRHIDEVYPDGKRCKWLKIEEDTGVMKGGEVFVMGTCKLFSDVVYDRTCYGCSGYEAS